MLSPKRLGCCMTLNHDNIVGFKAVCDEPVAHMLEYVYFDLSVFGGEGKVSS